MVHYIKSLMCTVHSVYTRVSPVSFIAKLQLHDDLFHVDLTRSGPLQEAHKSCSFMRQKY